MDTSTYGFSNILAGGGAAFSSARDLDPELDQAAKSKPSGAEPFIDETALTLSDTTLNIPDTTNGKLVLGVVSAAFDWADTAGHPEVDLDSIVFVLARSLASTLGAAGIVDVEGLRAQLGAHIMRQTSDGARADKPAPVIGDDVHAVLLHARGRAREKKRSSSNIEDLLDAIVWAIRNGNYQSQGAALLHQRWRLLALDAVVPQVMAGLSQLQTQLAGTVEQAVERRFRVVSDQISAEHGAIERLTEEVGCVSRRLPQPEVRQALPEIPPTPPPRSWEFWKRLTARRPAAAA